MNLHISIVLIVTVIALLIISFVPVVFAQEALVQCGGAGQNPCTYSDLVGLVGRVINFAILYIAIPVGVAFIIYGGVLIMISGGDEGKVTKAKELIRSVAVGLLITFGAWAIIQTVLNLLFKSS